MAKSPKPDKDLPESVANEDPVAQDAIEDAVVIEDTAPEPLVETQSEDQSDEDQDVSEDDALGEEDLTPSKEHETSDPVEAVPAPQEKKRGGVLGALVGGVIAGAIGFGAAQYAEGDWPFNVLMPKDGTEEQDPVQSALDNQTTQLADLSQRVEANSTSIATLKGDTSVDELGGQLRADIVATQSRLEELSGRLGGLEERMTSLEKMPQGDSAEAAQAAAAAYERELSEMREMLDLEIAALQEKQEEAQSLEVNAAEAAKAAAARAAMSRIMAAMESGQAFDDALFDLTTATGTEAPAELSAVADAGVPTLAALQEAFPEAARAALDEALRDLVAKDEISRGQAFLRTQLGTRSLEPKEGDDPDAVLSRAEFALKNGRISEALDEFGSLPEAAQPAMTDWVSMATTRAEALNAAAALSDTMTQ